MAELQMLPDPDLNADDRNMGLDTAVASEPDEPQLESPRGDPPVEGDGGANKYAATELARLRRNYSRASSYHRQGASIASKKPVTLRECCIYNLKKFWRHQISVTVDYDTCRDHLGECCPDCESLSSLLASITELTFHLESICSFHGIA